MLVKIFNCETGKVLARIKFSEKDYKKVCNMAALILRSGAFGRECDYEVDEE